MTEGWYKLAIQKRLLPALRLKSCRSILHSVNIGNYEVATHEKLDTALGSEVGFSYHESVISLRAIRVNWCFDDLVM